MALVGKNLAPFDVDAGVRAASGSDTGEKRFGLGIISHGAVNIPEIGAERLTEDVAKFAVGRGEFALEGHIGGAVAGERVEVLLATLRHQHAGARGSGQACKGVFDSEQEGVCGCAHLRKTALRLAVLLESQQGRDANGKEHGCK